MKNKKAIINIENVWKTYKLGSQKVHALKGVSLRVNQGEFLAITGPSGSGKSTFMNMIGCLDVPTKGTVMLEGQDISKLKESDLAGLRGKTIGFIFQQFNLMTSLSAEENVMLPLLFQREPLKSRKAKAKKYLDLVGLGDRLGHTPKQLSGGQQQRVAIARALGNNPKLLLADEPTGNLDSKSGEVVMSFLKKLQKENDTTIVLVTHDEQVALQADRRVFIKDGFIVNSLDEDTSKYLMEEK